MQGLESQRNGLHKSYRPAALAEISSTFDIKTKNKVSSSWFGTICEKLQKKVVVLLLQHRQARAKPSGCKQTARRPERSGCRESLPSSTHSSQPTVSSSVKSTVLNAEAIGMFSFFLSVLFRSKTLWGRIAERQPERCCKWFYAVENGNNTGFIIWTQTKIVFLFRSIFNRNWLWKKVLLFSKRFFLKQFILYIHFKQLLRELPCKRNVLKEIKTNSANARAVMPLFLLQNLYWETSQLSYMPRSARICTPP